MRYFRRPRLPVLRPFRASLPCVLVLTCVFAAGATAQVRPLPPPAPPAADTSASGALRLAGAYLDAGQPERAIPLLEDLLEAAPDAYPVYARLRDAYVAARRFDDLVSLIDRRLARAPSDVGLRAEHGAALFRAGRTDEAEAVWTRAVAHAPDAEMTYRTVADAQGSLALYPEAVATLLLGRERLGDPARFRAELANLYGLSGDPGRAADEWFALLAEQPDADETVRSRLARLLDRPMSGGRREGGPAETALSPEAALAEAAARAVRRAPLSRPVREIAAWLAMQRGDWAAALDAHIAIDRLDGGQGQPLVTFGESAAAAGADEPAARAFALVGERHPGTPAAALARYGEADLATRRAATERAGGPTPEARRAFDAFVAFAREYPGHPRASVALRRAAGLARDALGDDDAAERLLQDAAGRIGLEAGEVAQIRLDLAKLALRRGDLDDARALFTAVEVAERIGQSAEAARIELAYLDFYAGDTEGALTRALAMNANTATDVANDALLLRLLLTENVAPDSSVTQLGAYARASLRLRQGRADDAVAVLDSLIGGHVGHPIVDDAEFLRARALRAAGRALEALAALEAFPSRYAESFLIERARFLRAEVLERDVGDARAAREAYDAFLDRHPRSVLGPEARARLRTLLPPG